MFGTTLSPRHDPCYRQTCFRCGSRIAAGREALKNIAEQHVLLVDLVRRRQIAQRRAELAGKNPGARAHIDDQIGGRCLGEHVGKVPNQPTGVAWPVLGYTARRAGRASACPAPCRFLVVASILACPRGPGPASGMCLRGFVANDN